MGRRGGGRGQGHMKGFRPGKEPAHLKKRAAKARLGEDAGRTQEWLVEALVDHGPEGIKRTMGRWSLVLLILAFFLAAGGVPAYRWSLFAGIGIYVLAVVCLFFWYRLRKQREAVDRMARSLGLDHSPPKG